MLLMRMNVKVDNEEGSYSVSGITFILYNGFVTTCYTGYNHVLTCTSYL